MRNPRAGLRTLAAAFAAAAALNQAAQATTYYVATSGSNGNPGSSMQPWRTLQHAADNVGSGDTVIVRPGSYVGLHLTTSGSSGGPIAFRGEPGAIVNQRNSTTPDGINLEGASWVLVEGFTVVGIPRAGIRSVINDHVTIRGNVCDANGVWGILTGFSDDLLIEGNVTSRSVDEHGIYVGNSTDRPTIRNNLVWGNNGNGIHLNGDRFAGPGDGLIEQALVEGNVIHGNGAAGGSGINGDGLQSSIIRNNLLYDNHASGISLYAIDGSDGAKNNLVVNNTVLCASDGRWAVNIRDGSTGNVVANNILWSAHSFRGAIAITADSLSGFVSDHNVVENRFSTDGGGSGISLASWRTATGQDQGSINVGAPSPLFVDAAGGDYRLAEGSPAIDAGDPANAPVLDIQGYPRPLRAGHDAGAHEAPRFRDVPPPHAFYAFVETVARNGVTAGCLPGLYCPDDPVTRAQMSVFILRSKYGPAYLPPGETGGVFADVPAGSFAAAWIERLAAEAITAGCGGGNFCPGDAITRAQMSVFLLRGIHGPVYVPPPASGTVFADVSAGAFAAAWIEQAASEGITGGCGGGFFCPGFAVTRGQMAVFLTAGFDLP